MKQLKFADKLPQLILSGKKTATWRINDKRGVIKGDILSLCYNDGIEFAKAETFWVKEVAFEGMTKKDKEGHEKYPSKEQMYKTFKKYYAMEVTPKTKVKIIKFRLLK